jgi:cytochrome c-type biogenesis protein CcsB
VLGFVAICAGAGLSLLAAAWAVVRLLGRNDSGGRGPEAALVLALAAIVAFLVARGVETGSFPATGLCESLSLFSFAVGACYLALARAQDRRGLGAMVLPGGAALAVGGAISSASARPFSQAFDQMFLAVHATSFFAAYAALAVGAGAGVAYLIQERALRSKRPGTLSDRLPPLAVLDALSFRAVALGFPLLTVGMATGSVWSARVWGSFWFWEPKLAAALVLWLYGAAIFHLRTIEKYQGRRTAILTIASGVLVAFVFLGAGLLPGGRHAFL